MLIDLEGHGRDGLEDLDLTRTVGWLAVVHPAWLEAAPGEPAAVTLRAVCDQLHRIPKHGLGYGVLRYLGDEETAGRLRSVPQAEVCFTTSANRRDASDGGRRGRLPTDPRSPSTVWAAAVRVLDFNAPTPTALHLGFTYSTNLHHRESIERVSADTLAEVRTLLASSSEGVSDGAEQDRPAKDADRL